MVDLRKPKTINLTFCNGLYNPFMVMLGMVYDWVYHIEVFVVNNGCIVTRTSFLFGFPVYVRFILQEVGKLLVSRTWGHSGCFFLRMRHEAKRNHRATVLAWSMAGDTNV